MVGSTADSPVMTAPDERLIHNYVSVCKCRSNTASGVVPEKVLEFLSGCHSSLLTLLWFLICSHAFSLTFHLWEPSKSQAWPDLSIAYTLAVRTKLRSEDSKPGP